MSALRDVEDPWNIHCETPPCGHELVSLLSHSDGGIGQVRVSSTVLKEPIRGQADVLDDLPEKDG
jgi:hypothetical protein